MCLRMLLHASELVCDFLCLLHIPILTGAKFDHGMTNPPWPYGRMVTLSDASIIFLAAIENSEGQSPLVKTQRSIRQLAIAGRHSMSGDVSP